ncbi:putative zinc finger protein 876 isoform X2 [Periplaneta americana]|uniref:putative zinc finger protein 876 isoform X2 n=1 Tax=Periplaneta americana TaxID=6978 RepID=UPI0037E87C49
MTRDCPRKFRTQLMIMSDVMLQLQPWDLSTVKQEQQEEEGVGGSAKFSRTCDTCSKTVCECRTQHDKPYLCNTCGKAFKTNAYLGEHKRIHTGEKPYKCDACSAAFAQRQSLLKHRHTHSGEKPCECKVCGKAFRTSYISEHRRVHTGEKPHKCKLCFSTFTRRQSLVKHTRIHTGEKPFMCETCGKSFTQRPHLKTHERIHNRDKTLWV